MLKFSEANAKTKRLAQISDLNVYLRNGKRKVYSLDLPAGYSCPGAWNCLSRCVGGKIQDGQFTKFRCFSATQEVVYPNVHKSRQHNLQLLRGLSYDDTFSLLADSMPRNAGIIRYHVSGDFFSIDYLTAAITFAWMRPDVLFYGYTKSLHLLRQITINKESDLSKGMILPNFLLTASKGGKYDHLIENMRTATVIYDEFEANGPIDHDDSHAATIGGSFCLLLHGVQPKDTLAAKAWQAIKKAKGGYSRV